jgi:hypothetical protein
MADKRYYLRLRFPKPRLHVVIAPSVSSIRGERNPPILGAPFIACLSR